MKESGVQGCRPAPGAEG
ncbi:hypothetical protein EYZ11_008088 [Aspergillus tanneri]|uniref:Uncharacterized protein n=1 Tax=Aspergillus tanneri TaxID=1220188 RepID=A0A4S3JBF0_9EURO|nr:hypothetical protein EYZ11_008088 [Aspergillus tanneri]